MLTALMFALHKAELYDALEILQGVVNVLLPGVPLG